MLTNLLLFAGVSLVVIVTPGPDTALTVRNALLGRRSGILTAVGVGTGQLAWALLTACGVASVLAAHQAALTVLRLAGAAYLPQFAGPDPSLSAMAGLGLLFAGITVMWLTAYALVVDRVRNVLQRNAVRQWIDRLTGVVLVGLGVRVATEAG